MLLPFSNVYALSDSIMKKDKQRQKSGHVKLLFELSFYSEKLRKDYDDFLKLYQNVLI